MSNKEWEVSYNEYNNTYTVKEAKKYDLSYTPSTTPTAREKLNKGLRKMGKGWKIFLTVLFNLYGSLYRFSSNTVIGCLFGLVELTLGKILPIVIFANFIDSLSSADYGEAWFFFLVFFIIMSICTMLWIVDLISVIVKNDIVFLGNKKYKNYRDYKKK